MSRVVVLASEAEADFEQYIDYLIDNDAKTAARKIKPRVDVFLELTLAAFPAIGRSVPGRDYLNARYLGPASWSGIR